MYQWMWPKLNRIRSDRHLYQAIEREFNATPNWPQLGRKESIKSKLFFKRVIVFFLMFWLFFMKSWIKHLQSWKVKRDQLWLKMSQAFWVTPKNGKRNSGSTAWERSKEKLVIKLLRWLKLWIHHRKLLRYRALRSPKRVKVFTGKIDRCPIRVLYECLSLPKRKTPKKSKHLLQVLPIYDRNPIHCSLRGS